MKDLLRKELYCYKIATLFMESIAPPSIDNPLLWLTPSPPHFYKKTLILTSMIFQKSQLPQLITGDKLLHIWWL